MELPTLQEEVERKALETLEMIYLDREVGKITEAQYSYALSVLWSASAGISGKDFMMMMELAEGARRDASGFSREYLRSPKGEIAKLTNSHDGKVRCEIIAADGLSRKEKTFDHSSEPGMYKAAKERFQKLSDMLFSKGFEEI